MVNILLRKLIVLKENLNFIVHLGSKVSTCSHQSEK
jgi:hypothetical protein